MKVYVLAGSLLLAGALAAQDNGLPKLRQLPPPLKNNVTTRPRLYTYTPNPSVVIDQSKLISTLPNGNKVYALPQGNMPCVVPDMSQYSGDRVVKPELKFTMPNPAKPPAPKTQVLTEDQLKELLEKKSRDNIPPSQ